MATRQEIDRFRIRGLCIRICIQLTLCASVEPVKKTGQKSVKNPSKEPLLVKKLERWFGKNARDLPWRKNPEPYFVWLSEIMLQQTQVVTVLPYFEKFTNKYKTVSALAQAPLDDILKLWAGLGYYSRARNLHKGAQAMAERIAQGKGFPSNREEWLSIPGVGEYTAGAVCSIALNLPEPIVDGNVVRVLSRIYAIGEIDAKKTQIWDQARALVQVKGADPRALNQSLMELGATICKPKNPQCLLCPVQDECEGKFAPEKYPPPKPKKEWKAVHEQKWVLIDRTSKGLQIYLEQNEKKSREEKGWREGLWDFPNAGSLKIASVAKALSEFSTKYVVTTHKIARDHQVFQIKAAALKNGRGKWFSLNEKDDALPGVPSPVTKAIRKIKSLA
jgi:A/G-specific adenine glycosylase